MEEKREAELLTLTQKVQELQDRLNASELEIDELKAKNVVICAELDEARLEASSSQATFDSDLLKKSGESDELRRNLSEFTVQCAKLTVEKKQLEDEVALFNESKVAMSKYDWQMNEILQMVNEEKVVRGHLRSLASKLIEEVDSLRSQTTEKDANNAIKDVNNAPTSNSVVNNNNNNNSENKENITIIKENEQSHHVYKNSTVSSSSTTSSNNSSSSSAWKNRCSEKRERINAQNMQIALEKEFQAKEALLDENQALKNELDARQHKLAELADSHQDELNKSAAHIDELKQQLNAEQQKIVLFQQQLTQQQQQLQQQHHQRSNSSTKSNANNTNNTSNDNTNSKTMSSTYLALAKQKAETDAQLQQQVKSSSDETTTTPTKTSSDPSTQTTTTNPTTATTNPVVESNSTTQQQQQQLVSASSSVTNSCSSSSRLSSGSFINANGATINIVNKTTQQHQQHHKQNQNHSLHANNNNNYSTVSSTNSSTTTNPINNPNTAIQCPSQSAQSQAVVSHHRFEVVSFSTIERCEYCCGILYGICRQAVRCRDKNCNYLCHPKCIQYLPTNCPININQRMQLKGVDFTRGIGTLMKGNLKVPKVGGVKKGWIDHYVFLSNARLFVCPIVDNRPSLTPSQIVDIRDPQFSVSSVNETDVIHASKKDIPCILKMIVTKLKTPQQRQKLLFCAKDEKDKNNWIIMLKDLNERLIQLPLHSPPSPSASSTNSNGSSSANSASATNAGAGGGTICLPIEAREICDATQIRNAYSACVYDSERLLIASDEGIDVIDIKSDCTIQRFHDKRTFLIDVFREEKLIVAISGKQHQVFLFPTIVIEGMSAEAIKMDETKNCTLFCIGTLTMQAPVSSQSSSDNHNQQTDPSMSSSSIQTQQNNRTTMFIRLLCVAIKKVITVYEINSAMKPKYKKLRDIELTMVCQSMQIINNQLCVGFQSEFALYSLAQEQAPIALLQPDRDKSLQFLIKDPINALLAVQITQDEYLLVFENLGVYVNINGCRSRVEEIMWPSKPLHVAYTDPYLLCFCDRGIDVFHVKSGEWIQIIQFAKTKPLDRAGALCLSSESQDSIRLIHFKAIGSEEILSLMTMKNRSLVKSKFRKGSLNRSDDTFLSLSNPAHHPAHSNHHHNHHNHHSHHNNMNNNNASLLSSHNHQNNNINHSGNNTSVSSSNNNNNINNDNINNNNNSHHYHHLPPQGGSSALNYSTSAVSSSGGSVGGSQGQAVNQAANQNGSGSGGSSSRKSLISNPINFQHIQHMGPSDGKTFMHCDPITTTPNNNNNTGSNLQHSESARVHSAHSAQAQPPNPAVVSVTSVLDSTTLSSGSTGSSGYSVANHQQQQQNNNNKSRHNHNNSHHNHHQQNGHHHNNLQNLHHHHSQQQRSTSSVTNGSGSTNKPPAIAKAEISAPTNFRHIVRGLDDYSSSASSASSPQQTTCNSNSNNNSTSVNKLITTTTNSGGSGGTRNGTGRSVSSSSRIGVQSSPSSVSGHSSVVHAHIGTGLDSDPNSNPSSRHNNNNQHQQNHQQNNLPVIQQPNNNNNNNNNSRTTNKSSSLSSSSSSSSSILHSPSQQNSPNQQQQQHQQQQGVNNNSVSPPPVPSSSSSVGGNGGEGGGELNLSQTINNTLKASSVLYNAKIYNRNFGENVKH